MKVADTFICINCDELFEGLETCGDHCPACGAKAVWPLAHWLKPMEAGI